MGKIRKSKFLKIIQKLLKINKNHIKLQNWNKFRFSFACLELRESPVNAGFHVFCFFTPLFCRFRLSRVFQTTEREEIYRLV